MVGFLRGVVVISFQVWSSQIIFYIYILHLKFAVAFDICSYFSSDRDEHKHRELPGECFDNASNMSGGYKVKSSHLYLYSAFNNTNCNKALHNIKIGKLCQ